MKPVFDPKWLPSFKEVSVPVLTVETKDKIVENIRRLAHAMHSEPMVIFDLPAMERHIHPLGPDGAFHYSHSEKVHPYALGIGPPPKLDISKLVGELKLASIDLSEYAAPDSKSVVNKALRKKRDAQKASQNAKGRKWWEHR